MTDKVQKIREEVEIVVNRRLNLLNGDYFNLNEETDGLTNEIMDIIDSLQEETDEIVDKYLYGKEPEMVDIDDLPKEEPVSVWHYQKNEPVNKIADKSRPIIVVYGNNSLNAAGKFRYYEDNFDAIWLSNSYEKWAFVEDLINLTHSVTKVNWQEEPVNIWHDAVEATPTQGSNILMIRKNEEDSNYPPIAGCFHGTSFKIDNKLYWGYYNGFCYNEIEPPVKWAYIDELLKLSEYDR